MAQNSPSDPSQFVEAVLLRCPSMSAEDAELLRAAVYVTLPGRPVVEWVEAFADLLIDHRDEPFARLFFECSVGAGMVETFGYSELGPAAMAAEMHRLMPPKTAELALTLALGSLAEGSSAADACR